MRGSGEERSEFNIKLLDNLNFPSLYSLLELI